MLTDEDAALQAIASLEKLSQEQQDALNSITTIIHDGEPFVDVHELFAYYNVLYFQGLLLPRVEVLWSPRLTLPKDWQVHAHSFEAEHTAAAISAPLGHDQHAATRGKHAYFFITTSWKHSRGDDGTGHGVGFQLLADAINNHGNYEVTIYHTFHDEVESFRTHVWRCDGPCQRHPPYFGLVKRSMNRAPGKSDTWWSKHETECGGTYTKISEPAMTKKQLEAMSAKERAGRQKNKLDSWVTTSSKNGQAEGNTSDRPIDVDEEDKTSTATNKKRKGSALAVDDVVKNTTSKRARSVREDASPAVDSKTMVQCPICNEDVAETHINAHLDSKHLNE